ncbi:GlyGly-CTERM sorting domain-containing protein [Pelomonas sp. V22]|nr:GlyGly-CTERM sorting domain-containing protein [Pelomonas sp. V22]MDI4633326.1 GlyGly-CTERM sorting domain-containing protein [Pelomonas sp. V22]
MSLDETSQQALSRLTAGGALGVLSLALLIVAARFLN